MLALFAAAHSHHLFGQHAAAGNRALAVALLLLLVPLRLLHPPLAGCHNLLLLLLLLLSCPLQLPGALLLLQLPLAHCALLLPLCCQQHLALSLLQLQTLPL
jgi:hypothetical protein